MPWSDQLRDLYLKNKGYKLTLPRFILFFSFSLSMLGGYRLGLYLNNVFNGCKASPVTTAKTTTTDVPITTTSAPITTSTAVTTSKTKSTTKKTKTTATPTVTGGTCSYNGDQFCVTSDGNCKLTENTSLDIHGSRQA